MRHSVRWVRISVPGLFLIALASSNGLWTSNEWWGNFGNAIERANVGLFIAAPVIAGISAFMGEPWASKQMRRVTGLGPSPLGISRYLWSTFTSGLVTALLAYAVVLGSALLAVLPTHPTDETVWSSALYALIPIVLSCGVGTLFSVLFPSRWSPLIAAGAAVAIAYLSISATQAGLFQIGGWRDTVGWRYVGGSAIFLSVTAAVTLVVMAVACYAALREKNLVAGILSAVAVLVIVIPGWAAPGLTARLSAATKPSAVVCVQGETEFCLANGHTRLLAPQADVLERAAAPLRAVAPAFPSSFAESGNEQFMPDRGRALLRLTRNPNVTILGLWDAAYALTDPAACPQFRGNELTAEGEALLSAQVLIATWVAQGVDDEGGMSQPGAQQLRLDDGDVGLLYGALQQCSASPAAAAVLDAAKGF